MFGPARHGLYLNFEALSPDVRTIETGDEYQKGKTPPQTWGT